MDPGVGAGKRGIAVEPSTQQAMHSTLVASVEDAGGEVVESNEAGALIWADPAAIQLFGEVMARSPNVTWVQLPYAGVEDFLEHLDHSHVWTCGKGVYAEPVAEFVMAALLLALRDFHRFVPARSWQPQTGRNLLGAKLTLLGAGGIASSLLRLLEPWNCEVTVVRRSPAAFPGADRTVTLDRISEAVAQADAVIVALALTAETRHVIDENLLAAMSAEAWLVNVGRGGHVDHDALVRALRAGSISGAVLDVTDPEPLGDDSELWQLPNCIITPHIGNTPEMGLPLIAGRVRDNVALWLAGEQLIGLIDVDRGY